MNTRIALSHLVALIALSCLVAMPVAAADDPSIRGEQRAGISQAMKDHIAHATVDGTLYIYDLPTDEVLQLREANLHDGIVKKGGFFVSCADYVDQHDRKIDVDFLVRETSDGWVAVQGFVHKIDGEKRPYDLGDG